MKTYDDNWLKIDVAADMKRRSKMGIYDPTPRPGKPSAYYEPRNLYYLEQCKGFHQPTGSLLIFTRDTGHHRCGWWRNPDYESCWHLSISY